MAAALLACRADPSLVNERGLTPLGEALAGGHVEAAKQLVAAGAQLTQQAGGCVQAHACTHWVLCSTTGRQHAWLPGGQSGAWSIWLQP